MDKQGVNMPPTGNGWEEWRKHVLNEISRHNECVNKIDSKVDKLEDKFDARFDALRKELATLSIDVTTNKVKIALVGSVGGFFGGILASIVTAFILGVL